jgi:hypothetical protein
VVVEIQHLLPGLAAINGLDTPRSVLFLKMSPVIAANATSGFAGWILKPPVCPASRSPANAHVFPASVDL